MVLGDTRQAALLGDLAALAAALGFAVFTILLRRGKSSDMMPAVLLSGLLSIPIMALLCVHAGEPLSIQFNDYVISTTLGIFQMGMGLLLFTLGSRVLTAASLALLSLSEVFFAPLWVWIFLDETIKEHTLLGGGVLLLAIVWNIMAGPATSCSRTKLIRPSMVTPPPNGGTAVTEYLEMHFNHADTHADQLHMREGSPVGRWHSVKSELPRLLSSRASPSTIAVITDEAGAHP